MVSFVCSTTYRVGIVIYVLTVHFDGTVGLAVKFEWFLGLDCSGLLQVNTLGVVEGFQAALS